MEMKKKCKTEILNLFVPFNGYTNGKMLGM